MTTATTDEAVSATTARRPGNATKRHDNRRVSAFVAAFDTVSDLCEEFPTVADILTGVSWLKSPGDTSTRPLSRAVLFHVLARCEDITTEATARATHWRYKRAGVERYAAHARAASKAVAALLDRIPAMERRTAALTAERQAMDAPYQAQLQALGLA
jgi:hypothetical protein